VERRTFLQNLILGSVATAVSPGLSFAGTQTANPEQVKDYLTKIENFNQHFGDDIILKGQELTTLNAVVARLGRLQSFIGYANFSLVSFDKALYFARNYSKIGRFSKQEVAFLESIFYTNAKDYGFFGEKVSSSITDSVKSRDILKIARTGHYVYRGKSLRMYHRIRREVGSSITLTSGVRGVVKQMLLFLDKAKDANGNLSLASRSLAPPGHSFHGIGDFDVGKKGFGYRNFTADFAQTDEFKRLEQLGFIQIRYHEKNPFGVRYEPWHVKVT